MIFSPKKVRQPGAWLCWRARAPGVESAADHHPGPAAHHPRDQEHAGEEAEAHHPGEDRTRG